MGIMREAVQEKWTVDLPHNLRSLALKVTEQPLEPSPWNELRLALLACQVSNKQIQACLNVLPNTKNELKAQQLKEKGNILFEKKNFLDAIKAYSEAILHAPSPDTDEFSNSSTLALCFSNRGSALFHAKRFREALTDVKCAASSNYPEKKATKLAEKISRFKHACTNDLTEKGSAASDSNENSDSNLYELSFDDYRGRMLKAKQDLSSAVFILSENPLICIPTIDRLGHLCSFCLGRCEVPYPYAIINEECRFLRTPLVVDGQISLASCLAVRGAIACNGQNDYCTLVANMESISRDLCVEYALTACFVGALLPRISMINIYMSHLRVRCNGIALKSATFGIDNTVRYGLALYSKISLLNHDCANSNVMVTFNDARAIVATISPVKAGEELLLCYGPHVSRHNIETRQKMLQEQYGFICKCLACSKTDKDDNNLCGYVCSAGQHIFKNLETAPILKSMLSPSCKAGGLLQSSDDEDVLICKYCSMRMEKGRLVSTTASADRVYSLVHHSLEERNFTKAKRLLQQCLSLRSQVFPASSIEMGAVYDYIARFYALQGKYSQAAQWLKASTVTVQQHFGDASFEFAKESFKLAQMYFNAQDVIKARQAVERAQRLLHPFTLIDDTADLLDELRQMDLCLRFSDFRY